MLALERRLQAPEGRPRSWLESLQDAREGGGPSLPLGERLSRQQPATHTLTHFPMRNGMGELKVSSDGTRRDSN